MNPGQTIIYGGYFLLAIMVVFTIMAYWNYVKYYKNKDIKA